MIRVGAVSIAPQIPDPQAVPFDKLYQAVGLNTGNYMFTTAAFREIDGVVEQIGFAFDPEQVNANYDAVIVPAANWLNDKQDWDWLSDLIQRLEIPVITVGLGVQANSENPNDLKVNESCVRLVRILAQKGNFISTRGNFTSAYLNSIGILNTVATGCPSLYMRPSQDETPAVGGSGYVVQSTRYSINSEFVAHNSVNQRIFSEAVRHGHSMIYQSEPEEMQLLLSKLQPTEQLTTRLPILSKLYGVGGGDEFLSYLREFGRVFFSIEEWSTALKKYDLQCGTRLHGTILAMNSGVRAMLIAHDSRTSEMAELASLPTVGSDIDLSPQSLEAAWNDEFRNRYEEKRAFNAGIFRQFMHENGLPPREEVLF